MRVEIIFLKPAGLRGFSIRGLPILSRKLRAFGVNAPPVIKITRSAREGWVSASHEYSSAPDMEGIITSHMMRSNP